MRKVNLYLTEVKWERILLHIEVRADDSINLSDNVRFYLVNADYTVEASFGISDRTGNCFRLILNITNSGYNRCIDNDVYAILMVDGESAFGLADYTGDYRVLETWGRCFRYRNDRGAYTVTFMMDEYSETRQVKIQCYNMSKRGMSYIDHLPLLTEEQNEKQSLVDKFKNRYRTKWKKEYYQIWHALYSHKKRKTILFLSEQDTKPAPNMECVYTRLKERGLEREFELLQSYRLATSVEQSIKDNFKAVRLIAKANILIVDDHVPTLDWLVLDSKTTVIQLWHAGAGFKGVGYSRWGHYGCPGPFCCHRQYTYCITGSKEIAGFFSEQFGILDEQIIPTGMPRMDIFLEEKNKERIAEQLYAEFPQAKGKRVILFAPTYRGQNRKTAYYPYDKIDFQDLYRYCMEQQAVVFFKMHPWVSTAVPIADEYKNVFFDLGCYPDINNLFYITDLLITDYSSSIYEFSLLEKPMLFFAYDKDQYASSRGFHRDYDSNVPGKVCETFEEIMAALRNSEFDIEMSREYKKKHFDHVDTDNTDRVIDWLILGKLPDQYKDALIRKREEIQRTRGKSFAYLIKK